MSRKQELYRMLLEKGILIIRIQQSQLTSHPWWRVAPWKTQKLARDGYEVAQFLHQAPKLMAHEEFTAGDLWFLNNHAHSFYARLEPRKSFLYTQFLSQMRQLFRLVPEDLREELEWSGPGPPVLTPEWQEGLIADLFKAVEQDKDVEMLHYALDLGIDPNIRDSNGRTPLDLAEALGKAEHIQALKEAGARQVPQPAGDEDE